MDINRVIEEYDGLFGVSGPEQIDRFLDEKIAEAEAEPDASALLTLLNEQIGFCRDTGQKEKALAGCEKLKSLSREMGISGTVPYGTTLLNMANAYRVFGMYEDSAACYPEIEEIYQQNLPPGAFNFASLYNNWSLLLMEQGDDEGSIQMLKRALAITDGIPEAMIPQATSRINLAIALIDLADKAGSKGEDAESKILQAKEYLSEAIRRFVDAGGDDYHYSAALSAMADLKLRDGDAASAAADYEKAMTIMKMYMGENPKYQSLAKKRDYALSLAENGGNE